MAGPRCALLAAICAVLTGCGEQHFRAETVWLADGRIERAVYQPAEFFPGEARKGWEVVRTTETFSSDTFRGSIRDLVESADEPVSLAAWGTFLSAEDIPDYALFRGDDDSQVGRLERSAEVNRLGFVTEYVWQERLTDVVSLVDMQSSRRDSAALAAEFAETVLRDGSLRYEISDLLLWLRTDAVALLDETHGIFVEASVRGNINERSETELADRLADAAAKYGLNMRGEDGELLEGEDLDDAIARFLVAKLCETVRDSSGARIDEATARQLLGKFGVVWDGASLSWRPSEDWRRAITAQFGSEEAATAEAAKLMTRLFGVHRAGLFVPPRRFFYEMTLPGSIVATTGERIGEGRVVWRFDAAQAFPFGYEMSARSLVANNAVQKAVFGTVRLTNLDQLAEYALLVKSDPALADLMDRCIKAGSLKPLDDLAAEASQAEEIEPAAHGRLVRLQKLLSR